MRKATMRLLDTSVMVSGPDRIHIRMGASVTVGKNRLRVSMGRKVFEVDLKTESVSEFAINKATGAVEKLVGRAARAGRA